MSRLIAPLLFGLGGFAILVSLAVWQVQRLAWKEALIAEMTAKMDAAPVPLPEDPQAGTHGFMSTAVEGRFVGEALHVLTSARPGGPGFRVISAFETSDGRRVMVDRGYVPEAEKDRVWPNGPMDVTATLLWPEEVDSFTPAPNLERNIWFARDLTAMSELLRTEPVLLVAQSTTVTPSPRPLRVGVNLSNNHLQYAITWSLLAALWLAMTGYLVYRVRKNTL
ncbi:MAG: SURF1 family protein [Pseudomonadota bacterium]